MLRRARIKALAAVPVRKKPLQDSVDSINADTTSVDATDKEKKKENISNINEIEYKAKDIIKVKELQEEVVRTDTSEQNILSSIDIIPKQEKQKEKDIFSIDTLEQETVKDNAKVQEETKKEQDKVSLKKSVIVEKPDPQESCSLLKLDSQELRAQAKPNPQESLSTEFKSQDKIADKSIQKSTPLPDVPTAIDIGKKHRNIVKRLRNLDSETQKTYRKEYFIFLIFVNIST